MKRLVLSIATFIVFVVVIASVVVYYYSETKKQYVKEEEAVTERVVAQVDEIAQLSSKSHNYTLFNHSIDTLIENTPLQGVKLKYKDLSFTDAVIFSKIDSIDESWRIVDVTTDTLAGKIEHSQYGQYIFDPVDAYDLTKPLKIKFQAAKNGFIRDFTTTLPFIMQAGVGEFGDSAIENETYKLYYNVAKKDFSQQLYKDLMRFLALIAFVLFAVALAFYIFYKNVLQDKLYGAIGDINKYISNAIQRKFQDSKGLQFHKKELDDLLKNIDTLSKNYAQVVNELNVSRDIIEKKEITDDLTGLPNKKWFEKDLKYMFVANKPGYILYLKIDKLGEYAKKNGTEIVNSLVEDFAKTVENFFMSQKEIDGNVYRFFGAEFAMIIYVQESQKVREALDELIAKTRELDERYYFFDNHIYYGGTPFDKYGTVESILQSAKDEYQNAFKSKEGFYQISDLNDQIQKNKELEKSVRDIIDRDDFALQYVFDTYDFAATPNLIMQEVTPMLIDMRTFDRFPVGVFISVAEKIDLASEFDKLLINKALEHIKMGELEHKIAINLSVGSFTSMRFIIWLNSIINNEEDAKNLVFVTTAYSAAGNFDQYKRFVDAIVGLGGEVMLKRFDLNDFTLDQLKVIKPHYIRIERDYCNDIKRDTTKQHKIKQVLLFADEYNIKVLGDSVKSDIDYQTLERLGFYGTSR